MITIRSETRSVSIEIDDRDMASITQRFPEVAGTNCQHLRASEGEALDTLASLREEGWTVRQEHRPGDAHREWYATRD